MRNSYPLNLRLAFSICYTDPTLYTLRLDSYINLYLVSPTSQPCVHSILVSPVSSAVMHVTLISLVVCFHHFFLVSISLYFHDCLVCIRLQSASPDVILDTAKETYTQDASILSTLIYDVYGVYPNTALLPHTVVL
jgi:hypothetical protein